MDGSGRQTERRNGRSRSPWGGGMGGSSNGRPGKEALGNGARGADLEETRADVGSHGFWRRGTTALFDVRVVNLDTGS